MVKDCYRLSPGLASVAEGNGGVYAPIYISTFALHRTMDKQMLLTMWIEYLRVDGYLYKIE